MAEIVKKPKAAVKAKPASEKKAAAPKAEKSETKLEKKKKEPPVIIFLDRDQVLVKEGFNPREDLPRINELAHSIEANGIKQPLVGHATGKTGDGRIKYTLTDGHRRLAAWDKVGKKTMPIPLIVEPEAYTDLDRTFDLLIMNDSEPLTMLEEAEVCRRLIDEHKLSQADVAKRAGKSKMHISNCIALSGATPELKKQIKEGTVSATQALNTMKAAGSAEEAEKHIRKVAEEKVAKGESARVTKQDLPAKRSLPATSLDKEEKKAAKKENPPVAVKDGALEKLGKLLDVLKDQPQPKIEAAFAAVNAVFSWLQGEIPAKNLNVFFFTEE